MNFFLYAYSYTQTGGWKVTVRQRAMNGMEGREGEVETKCASAGNRTRVTSMATMYSTTRPLMLVLVRIARFWLATASETGCRTTRHADSKSMIKHSAPVAVLSGMSRFLFALTR